MKLYTYYPNRKKNKTKVKDYWYIKHSQKSTFNGSKIAHHQSKTENAEGNQKTQSILFNNNLLED